jgi:roadblock/LC7 domain-containing protein
LKEFKKGWGFDEMAESFAIASMKQVTWLPAYGFAVSGGIWT